MTEEEKVKAKEKAKEKDTEKVQPKVEKTEESEPTLKGLQDELATTKRLLAIANTEAKERRLKLEGLEKADAERKEAEMTELEKAVKRADDAEASAKDALEKAEKRVLEAEVKARAAALNFAEPGDALALLDKSSITSEDGEIKGLDEALKSLAEAKPYLLKQGKKGQKLGATLPGEHARPSGETIDERRSRLLG